MLLKMFTKELLSKNSLLSKYLDDEGLRTCILWNFKLNSAFFLS